MTAATIPASWASMNAAIPAGAKGPLENTSE
jgi:hypothetical protein